MNKLELAEKISNLVVAIVDDGPIERSRSFLPISPDVLIAPGELARIVARPQVPFRGDRLAVWSVCAASFFIESIQVGCQHVSAQFGSAPADAFATRLDLLPMLDQQLDRDGFVQVRVSRKAEECFGQQLSLPMCHVGQDITVVVTNVSDRSARFVGLILGDVECQVRPPRA